MPTLTPAQERVLAVLAEREREGYTESVKWVHSSNRTRRYSVAGSAAAVLVRLGLARRQSGAIFGAWNYRISDAGRELLADRETAP